MFFCWVRLDRNWTEKYSQKIFAKNLHNADYSILDRSNLRQIQLVILDTFFKLSANCRK